MSERIFRVGPADLPTPARIPENAGRCHECGATAWRADTFSDGRPNLVCIKCGHRRPFPRAIETPR